MTSPIEHNTSPPEALVAEGEHHFAQYHTVQISDDVRKAKNSHAIIIIIASIQVKVNQVGEAGTLSRHDMGSSRRQWDTMHSSIVLWVRTL